MRILGIAGSLRRGSYNRLLLRAAAERIPIEIYDGLGSIPLFNEDLESENAPHPPLRGTFSPQAGRRISKRTSNEIPLPAQRGEGGRRPGEGHVAALRERVASADGLLIATPEYNWSIPGVLKNAIDWLSRPPREVLARKKVAIIGASGGTWGTRLAQAALRQTLTATEAIVMPAPALFVARAENIFDAGGRLIDPHVSEQLDAVLTAFAAWIGC
jgi:chromate reductase, NAD(P)H dehydrogenase (quinone)